MPLPRFWKKAAAVAARGNGPELRVLVLGNGCAGAENQCMGLLRSLQIEAAGQYLLVPSFARVFPSTLWRLTPAFLHISLAGISPRLNSIGIPESARLLDGAHILTPPYPDLVIASGRTTAPACVAIKRASGGHSFTVQIQHPRVLSRGLFDAIVTPAHDLPRAPGQSAQQPADDGLGSAALMDLEERGTR
eukprot:1951128-Rhodomonas_salina.3